ncbi:protein singed wings 2 [Maniola hyperantus]|uniref:protein singed wings 2 n=1 Tax=Aphantopus hyperantus TaxID=2795564 RepID=UPI001568B956|nr:protein singed wings 2 [Maniola hyperantus]
MMSLRVMKTFLLLSLAQASTSGVKLNNHNRTDHLDGSCSLSDHTNRASCVRSSEALLCTRGFTNEWLLGVRYEILHLKLLQWPGHCFNVGHLQRHFPQLRTLEISNSTNLKTFKGHFESSSKIEKISMHGLTLLWEVPELMVGKMTQLRVLDLRNNTLRHMNVSLIRRPPQLETVYLGDNKWDCSDGGLDWLAMEKENGTVRKKLADYYQLMCHQQLYRGKPLYKVMDIIRMVKVTCPVMCACAMTHVVSDTKGAIIPLITVNCTNKQLKDPPASLPPSTTTLRLEGNKLTSIRQLVQYPQYQSLMDLYLDNNSIQSVKELEGSEWFSTFRVMSLRGNSLKQIPVYAFDKAFQANNNIMHVYLGHNPWRCDCHFVPRFQGLLLKYKRVIRDLTDIRCAKSDDKTISFVQISTMALGHVCQTSEVNMPISTINIVNLVLLVLILMVVGRFVYDWYRFRATGKLPWISSVMP